MTCFIALPGTYRLWGVFFAEIDLLGNLVDRCFFKSEGFCPKNGKNLRKKDYSVSKIFIDLYLTVGRVNKYYRY